MTARMRRNVRGTLRIYSRCAHFCVQQKQQENIEVLQRQGLLPPLCRTRRYREQSPGVLALQVQSTVVCHRKSCTPFLSSRGQNLQCASSYQIRETPRGCFLASGHDARCLCRVGSRPPPRVASSRASHSPPDNPWGDNWRFDQKGRRRA